MTSSSRMRAAMQSTLFAMAFLFGGNANAESPSRSLSPDEVYSIARNNADGSLDLFLQADFSWR